jgi:fumarylacetoacetate (FAA) hydrolase
VSLRNLIPTELAKGFRFLQSKPATSFSPVAVTPDELSDAWSGGKVRLPLRSTWNGKLVRQPHAGVDMVFNFPQLIAHLCKSRNARAGSIVGSGTVSNKIAGRGYSCIAEKRCLEMIADGVASTPFMLFGDTIRIGMLDGAGKSVFGAIDQTVTRAERRSFDDHRGSIASVPRRNQLIHKICNKNEKLAKLRLATWGR